MANHKSAEKAARQTIKRTLINRARKSRILTFIKKVEVAVAAGDKAIARQAMIVAESEIMRGVNKGVLKLNTASRKVSRLNARVKAIAS
jgi:small subunit ribosomal protein S20